jgi:hypothetical protein
MPADRESAPDEPYAVVTPVGPRADEDDPLEVAPRLANLSEAVVVELWDDVFRGDEVFPAVREELRRRYPGIKIIEYTEFGTIHVGDEQELLSRLPEFLWQRKTDAVIAGVGH